MGEFGRDVLLKLGLGGFADEAAEEPIYDIFASGIDTVIGLSFGLYAPAGATTVSPLTSVVYYAGGIDTVRAGLSLDDGQNRLRSSPNLLTFDVSRNLESSNANRRLDAARLLVVNLNVLNLTALTFAPQSIDGGFGGVGARLGEYLATGEALDFADADSILRFLDDLNYSCGGSADAREAGAELFAKYGSILPDTIDDLDLAAKYHLLFRFVIGPEFARLCANPTAATIAEVRGITPEEIEDQLAVFMSAARPTISGTLFAELDYREFTGTSFTLANDCDFPQSSYQRSPVCNDFEHVEGRIDDRSTITDVDSGNSSQLNVSVAANGRISITAVNGFRGLSFFDYDVQLDNGQRSTSRVYVRVR